MNRFDFLSRLKLYTDTPFDNEQEFLANFWEWNPDKAELLEFYMSEGTCKIVALMANGQTATATISTEEYIDWVEAILY